MRPGRDEHRDAIHEEPPPGLMWIMAAGDNFVR
jgi:hypothetical protein